MGQRRKQGDLELGKKGERASGKKDGTAHPVGTVARKHRPNTEDTGGRPDDDTENRWKTPHYKEPNPSGEKTNGRKSLPGKISCGRQSGIAAVKV